MVREGGLEPPRVTHGILSLARLPVPPLSRDTDSELLSDAACGRCLFVERSVG